MRAQCTPLETCAAAVPSLRAGQGLCRARGRIEPGWQCGAALFRASRHGSVWVGCAVHRCVCSRCARGSDCWTGHHADIGGISPGSMPPNSTTLAQEGAAMCSPTALLRAAALLPLRSAAPAALVCAAAGGAGSFPPAAAPQCPQSFEARPACLPSAQRGVQAGAGRRLRRGRHQCAAVRARLLWPAGRGRHALPGGQPF